MNVVLMLFHWLALIWIAGSALVLIERCVFALLGRAQPRDKVIRNLNVEIALEVFMLLIGCAIWMVTMP